MPLPGKVEMNPTVRCVTSNQKANHVTNMPTNFFYGQRSFESGHTRIIVRNSDIIDGVINMGECSKNIMKIESMSDGISNIQRTGEFKFGVIRVTGKDGYSPSRNLSQIRNDIFNDSLNLVVGYRECSGNKVNILPAIGEDLTGGAMDLKLTLQKARDAPSFNVENAVTFQLQEMGFYNRNTFTHLIYIFPEEVYFGNTAAYAYEGGHLSVYKNEMAAKHMVLMHEVGHNFGHLHSGKNSLGYADESCMMGAHLFANDAPRSCFNGAKSWFFGWYADRHIVVTPTSGSKNLKMLSIDDYLNGKANSNDQYTIAKVDGGSTQQLYVMYNRKEGVNREVQAHGDEVTIVQQKGDNRQSWLLAGLGDSSEWQKQNWDGKGNTLVIRVCGRIWGEPDYARIIIYLKNVNDLSCSNNPNPSPGPPRNPSYNPPGPPPTPSASSPTTDPPPPKRGTLIKSKVNNECVHMTGRSVVSSPCNGDMSQTWYFDATTKAVINAETGHCLDVDVNSRNIKVGTWECHFRPNQQWVLESNNRLKSLSFVPAFNGVYGCMDLTAENDLIVYPCHYNLNQKFYFVGVSDDQGNHDDPGQGWGERIIRTREGNGCMHMSTQYPNNVRIKNCDEGLIIQRWTLDRQNERIINVVTGLCLDWDRNSYNNNLVGWDCHGWNNQKWRYEETSENFKSLAMNEKCIDMTMDSQNSNLIVYDCHDDKNQRFYFE